jgi:hypothetical protein
VQIKKYINKKYMEQQLLEQQLLEQQLLEYSYNHFKGSKQAFNYKSYKSIMVVRFWLIGMLKGFKRSTNKIFRLKIYKWGLVEIMILISSFGWSDVITKKIWSKKPKLTQMT